MIDFHPIYCISLGLVFTWVTGCGNAPSVENTERSEDQKAAQQVILNLFQSMYEGDSAMAREAFVEEAKLYSIYQQHDSTIWKEGKLSQFLTAIGTPHQFQWIEKSWDYKIHVDGGLAEVWCEYAFFAGERFSHCGVDAFQLVKTSAGWKIFSLADTRRKEDCTFPADEFFEPNK